MHVGMPAGPCMFDLESGPRHPKPHPEVPHRVPRFDPALVKTVGRAGPTVFKHSMTDQVG